MIPMSMPGLKETGEAITERGGRSVACTGDISSRSHVQRAVESVTSHFKSTPSVGINCAGIIHLGI